MPSVIIKVVQGVPTADPEQLWVDPGDDFEFESDVDFKLVFDETAKSPDKHDPNKTKWKAEKDGGKHKVKMKAKNNDGRKPLVFPYTILIGEAALDPAIIIN